jgi:hypothetical protein
MNANDLVKFSNPNQDEIGLTMKVIEVNGDRALVEYQVGMNINPTAIVMTAEIEIA